MKNIFGNEETRKVIQMLPFPEHLKEFAKCPLYFTDEESAFRACGIAALDSGEIATVFMRGVAEYMIVTTKEMRLHRALEQLGYDMEGCPW